MIHCLETMERTGGRAGGNTVQDAEILTGSDQDGDN